MRCVKCNKTMGSPKGITRDTQICFKCRTGKGSGGYGRMTRKEFDLFCLKCNVSLPIGSHATREYCDDCWKEWRRTYNKKHYRVTAAGKKLAKFYDNQRIVLIQSPYFADMKTLSNIIMVENK